MVGVYPNMNPSVSAAEPLSTIWQIVFMASARWLAYKKVNTEFLWVAQ